MTSLRKSLIAILALPALLLALSAAPSAAAMGAGPQAAEACGVSGRCGDAPTHYVSVLRPDND